MKSKIYYHLSSVIALIFVLSFKTYACGPYPPMIPTPKFFTSNWDGLLRRYFNKQENLQLWQELTSNRIPLKDIEQAVYKDNSDIYRDMFSYYGDIHTDNLFYIYLHNTRNSELSDFLETAKMMEEKWAEINSPWYYPSQRNKETGDFQYIIDRCNDYKGNRLKDRYALQAVRALFASRRYDECIEHFREAFQSFPDSNLFKRMAMGYVAGCWSRLGEIEKANEYFAKSGDFYSIKAKDPIAFMAKRNPDNPELMSHIQSCSVDSAKFCAIKDIAEQVLRTNKEHNRGDWEFALAYMFGEFYTDYAKASLYIQKALQHKFSSDDLRDHARAYRMKIDAELGNSSSLLSDLKWMESKIDMFSPNANEWNRMMQNIVYAGWIPELWKKKDYTTAILLCGYADNLICNKRYTRAFDSSLLIYNIDSLKSDCLGECGRLWLDNDYCSLSFQLMGSLTSDQLIKVKHEISIDNALFSQLRKYARHDSDYINELIGTLSLREENYQKAVHYFANVSDKYLRMMNIYNYLNRDPFVAYSTGGTYKNESGQWVTSKYRYVLLEKGYGKYHFAKRMLALQKQMNYGNTADERGMARLKYAIGRRNSFEDCWALTQYWRGEYVGLFEPHLQYWNDGFDKYDGILYDYEKSNGHKKTEEIYQSEKKKAMSMLQSDEYIAEAKYMFGGYTTVIKCYSNTEAAQHIKTSCDDWQSWL